MFYNIKIKDHILKVDKVLVPFMDTHHF